VLFVAWAGMTLAVLWVGWRWWRDRDRLDSIE